MSLEEFWGATPLEVLLMIEASRERDRQQWWHTAYIASTIINSNAWRKSKRAVTPRELLGETNGLEAADMFATANDLLRHLRERNNG